MPSNSTGFCVAMTMNGRGSGWVCPSTDTCRSLIASSRALCVRGVARLISSASTILAKIGPGTEGELPRFGAIDAAARDIARQQVGRELDAAEFARQAAGDGLADQRLAHARHVFQEDMFAGQQGHDREPDDLALSQDDAADVLAQLGDERFGWIHGASIRWTTSILIDGEASQEALVLPFRHMVEGKGQCSPPTKYRIGRVFRRRLGLPSILRENVGPAWGLQRGVGPDSGHPLAGRQAQAHHYATDHVCVGTVPTYKRVPTVMSHPTSMIEVQEFNQIDALAGFRSAWRELLAQTAAASFFQSLEWLECYWRHFGGDQKLRVLVASDCRQPVGILPLVVRPETTRVGRLRILTYPLHDWATFYGPIGPCATTTLTAGLRHVRATPRDWDVMDLRWIDADGGDLGRTDRAMAQAGFPPHKQKWDRTRWLNCPKPGKSIGRAASRNSARISTASSGGWPNRASASSFAAAEARRSTGFSRNDSFQYRL